MWLTLGVPTWIIGLAAGEPLNFSSGLTHIGGLIIAFAGLKQRRMLRLENPFLEGISFDYRPYFYNPMTDRFGDP
jgi:hypothetical protein